MTFSEKKSDKIFSINVGRATEEFQNPFLSYGIYDCRNITDYFDVVFIPQHLDIKTDYLAYAPRRKEKTGSYIKDLGDDWYLESGGSMWSDDLRNCVKQNKSPN